MPKEAIDNLNNMLNMLEMTIPASITFAMLLSALIIILSICRF